MIKFTLPLRVNSTLNKREHWRVTAKRKWEHRSLARSAVVSAIGGKDFSMPIQVTITRFGKRKLDAHDNLRDSTKFVVDGIADALEVDDGNEAQVQWHYKQVSPADYAVMVEICEGGE